jgi:Arylsulfotransferase (ASST)
MSWKGCSRVVGAAVLVLAWGLAPARAPAEDSSLPAQYLSPVPGSTNLLPETNIILRPGGAVDASSVLGPTLLRAEGSESGPHEGRLRLSDDAATLTFQPFTRFLTGETVTCHLEAGLRTEAAGEVPPAEWSFTIAGPEREALRGYAPPAEEADEPPGLPDGFPVPAPAPTVADPAGAATDSLPEDFPRITATVSGNPAPGRLFLAGIKERNPNASSYLMIFENDGTPHFYRRLDGAGLDFKRQANGWLTYFDRTRRAFFALDSTYAVVDSFRCGNGYNTDAHELLLLPNGHALLMAYDPQIVDMSQIVPKGRAQATVLGLIIQELDRDKIVVFQWRSWDHFRILDALGIPFSRATIDYVHGNSLDVGPHGNILLSSRHMSEVTKISRATGDLLWRLGGKNNQFRFINDPVGFSYQHDARWLPDGRITLFDNGTFHSPPFSRAVEYELDEEKMTAKLVWQYRHDPDVFGFASGSVQRLSNGNTLIGWGFTTPTLTEVTPEKRVVMELSFDPGIATYRALRFEWPPMKSAIVDLAPRTINLGGVRGWITAAIESDGFDPSDVIVASVRLQGTIPADPGTASFGDTNADGARNLTLRFDGNAVTPILSRGANRLEVSGNLRTGERFHGYALVDVVAPRGESGEAPPLTLVSAPGGVPVHLELNASAAPARAFAVYDVQGRLVKRWREAAGHGSGVAWDGRGENGRRVGAGIYFIRAEEPGVAGRAAKVVIAR